MPPKDAAHWAIDKWKLFLTEGWSSALDDTVTDIEKRWNLNIREVSFPLAVNELVLEMREGEWRVRACSSALQESFRIRPGMTENEAQLKSEGQSLSFVRLLKPNEVLIKEGKVLLAGLQAFHEGAVPGISEEEARVRFPTLEIRRATDADSLSIMRSYPPVQELVERIVLTALQAPHVGIERLCEHLRKTMRPFGVPVGHFLAFAIQVSVLASWPARKFSSLAWKHFLAGPSGQQFAEHVARGTVKVMNQLSPNILMLNLLAFRFAEESLDELQKGMDGAAAEGLSYEQVLAKVGRKETFRDAHSPTEDPLASRVVKVIGPEIQLSGEGVVRDEAFGGSMALGTYRLLRDVALSVLAKTENPFKDMRSSLGGRIIEGTARMGLGATRVVIHLTLWVGDTRLVRAVARVHFEILAWTTTKAAAWVGKRDKVQVAWHTLRVSRAAVSNFLKYHHGAVSALGATSQVAESMEEGAPNRLALEAFLGRYKMDLEKRARTSLVKVREESFFKNSDPWSGEALRYRVFVAQNGGRSVDPEELSDYMDQNFGDQLSDYPSELRQYAESMPWKELCAPLALAGLHGAKAFFGAKEADTAVDKLRVDLDGLDQADTPSKFIHELMLLAMDLKLQMVNISRFEADEAELSYQKLHEGLVELWSELLVLQGDGIVDEQQCADLNKFLKTEETRTLLKSLKAHAKTEKTRVQGLRSSVSKSSLEAFQKSYIETLRVELDAAMALDLQDRRSPTAVLNNVRSWLVSQPLYRHQEVRQLFEVWETRTEKTVESLRREPSSALRQERFVDEIERVGKQVLQVWDDDRKKQLHSVRHAYNSLHSLERLAGKKEDLSVDAVRDFSMASGQALKEVLVSLDVSLKELATLRARSVQESTQWARAVGQRKQDRQEAIEKLIADTEKLEGTVCEKAQEGLLAKPEPSTAAKVASLLWSPVFYVMGRDQKAIDIEDARLSVLAKEDPKVVKVEKALILADFKRRRDKKAIELEEARFRRHHYKDTKRWLKLDPVERYGMLVQAEEDLGSRLGVPKTTA